MLGLPPSFQNRRFVYFWIGLVLAWTGYFMLQWTVLWQIRMLSSLPLSLGVVGLVKVIATIGFSLFAGVVADVLNRRKVVVLTQSTMGLISIYLAILTFLGNIQLWQIYLLIGIQAAAFSFDLPARQSLVPNLVPIKHLPSAFSLESIAYQIGAFIGPMLCGLIIDRLGLVPTYVVSSISTGFMVTTLMFLGEVPQEIIKYPHFDLSVIKDGIRFTFQQPLISSSMILDFLVTSLTRADTLMPIIAKDLIGVNAVGYGWLSAAQSVGATISGGVISLLREVRRQGLVLVLASILVGIASILFGISRLFILSMIALIMIGSADAISSIIRSTIRQLHTPDSIRGRIVSVNQIFFNGGPQLGELKSGILAQLIGVPSTLVLGGLSCLISVSWVTHHWPELSKYNGG